MSAPKFIGLHSRLGGGKDTTFERMCVIAPDLFTQHSFAAKLKQATAALYDVTVEQLEEWKRDAGATTKIRFPDPEVPGVFGSSRALTIREVLQRMGTEVGREIFGQSFWVDQAMGAAKLSREGGYVPVFTDCRFPNEAEAIIAEGGEVWRIIGDDEDTGDHPSERPLPGDLISHVIDNTIRDDNFANLDNEVREALQLTGVVS
jgi:hypothetical protein